MGEIYTKVHCDKDWSPTYERVDDDDEVSPQFRFDNRQQKGGEFIIRVTKAVLEKSCLIDLLMTYTLITSFIGEVVITEEGAYGYQLPA